MIEGAQLTVSATCASCPEECSRLLSSPMHHIHDRTQIRRELGGLTTCQRAGELRRIVVDGAERPCLRATTERDEVTCRACLEWLHS